MEEMDRRGLFAALSALGAMAAASQVAAQPLGPMTQAQLARSRVIKFKDVPTRKLANGGVQRVVMSGTLPTGEFIEIHETLLPAGAMPHAPHRHPNSEWLFIQSGKLEFIDDDTKTVTPVEPLDIVFSASNASHGLRNVGDTPATYIVFSVSAQLETPQRPG
jgi:quercetin dioxygenase-like cupin family protein